MRQHPRFEARFAAPGRPTGRPTPWAVAVAVTVCTVPAACSGAGTTGGDAQPDGGSAATSGDDAGASPSTTAHGGGTAGSTQGGASGGSSGRAAGGGAPGGSPQGGSRDAGARDADADAPAPGTGASDAGLTGATDGGYPSGWLYTSGNKVYVSNGASGTPWMGRGVNVDDIFFCGYDNTLWMTSPDQTLETVVSGLMSAWKPSFVRISLAMDSYSSTTIASWLTNPSQYKTPMTNVIDAIGANAGVHVLVTLRSDASMIGQDTADGDPEATGLPSDATTTPNATAYPTGTDAVYVALVDTFANAGFVMFGLTNEPGGNKLSNATIASAMKHAVGVIRAEEDRLRVPHHIVSVQGNSWTSDISFYAASPIPYDNVVYEIHGYPPSTSSYTY